MQIRLTHSEYNFISQIDNKLVLQGNRDITLYGEKVIESTVTISRDLIHVVALINDRTIKHWYGTTEFLSQTVKTTPGKICGLRLITDSKGTPHLFYLHQDNTETGYTLIQHTFHGGQWGDGLRVTGNISRESQHYQVGFGRDQVLYLVYASREQDVLYLRNGNGDSKLWSGAMLLAKNQIDQVNLYVDDTRLLIFWISDQEEKRVLQGILFDETWGAPHNLAKNLKDIFQPGIQLTEDEITLIWAGNGKLWRACFDNQWSEAKQLEYDKVTLIHQTILANDPDNLGCVVLPVYQFEETANTVVKDKDMKPSEQVHDQPKKVSAKQSEKESAPSKTRADLEAEKAQKELERRFFAEAFQLHQEWQTLKEQYHEALQDREIVAKQISDHLEAKLEDLVTNKLDNYTSSAETKLLSDLDLLTQRVQVFREELRSLKSRQQQVNNTTIDQLQTRINKIEVSLRTKITEAHLQSIVDRVTKLEKLVEFPTEGKTIFQRIFTRR